MTVKKEIPNGSRKKFIKKLNVLETSKSPQDKFRDFLEMVYCACAKKTVAKDKANALEERYIRLS